MSQAGPSCTHCCPACCWAGYLTRGPRPPFWRRGKNNNLQAKKLGAYLSRGRKRLCSLCAQRLFITLTRGWRKCSICWVQPAAHTAYKLRAFTCTVPEIKHTHTHTKERGVSCRPRRAASPWLSLRPSPGPALAPVQEFHIISERFQLPQQGTALLLSSCSHIWKVLGRGVSRQGQQGWHALPPARHAGPSTLPASLPAPCLACLDIPCPDTALSLQTACPRGLRG